MASKQEKQERKSGTKNRSTPYSEYEDPSQLKGEASNSKPDDQNRQAQYVPEKRSDYEDRDFSTHNIAQLTSYEDFSPDGRTTSSEDKRSDYEDRNFSTINIAQLTSYEDFSPDRRTTSSEEKRNDYEDRDCSTINIAQLTSYEDPSPDRRTTSSEDKRSDYEYIDCSTINIAQLTSYEDFSTDRSSKDFREIVIKILFERMTMIEKTVETLKNRQDVLEGLNSEAKTSKPKKEKSKVKGTPIPDAIKPIKRQKRTLQSLLDELHNSYMAGRKSKANFCLSEIKKLMTSSNRPKATEVKKMAEKYIDNPSYIKAAILLSWAAELHVTDSDPDEAALAIADCAHIYVQVIGHMIDLKGKMHTIAKDFGVDIILKMLGNLRGITSADVMFKYETRTLSNVGTCHNRLGHNSDAIKFYRQGMDLFERKYESKAMELYDYGTLLHNTGVAHSHLGNNAEAEKYYLDALKSYKASTDWKYKGQKKDLITNTEEKLKRLRLEFKNE
ncbi:uncharacterized protein LOC120345633 [Styela clava]